MNYDHWKTTNPQDEELGNKEQPSHGTDLFEDEEMVAFILKLRKERGCLKASAASIKSDYRLPPQISRAANDSISWQRLK
jgi:hypothetical protein